MKKIFCLLVFISAVFLISGCGSASKDKNYSNNHFEITMQEGFSEKSLASATVYYESTDVILSALKEEFTLLESIGISEESTIDEYFEAINANNLSDYEIKTDGNLKYFTYEQEVHGKSFFYLGVVYKSNDAFWLFNFAAETKNKEKYESLFIKWAKTSEFK